MAKSNDNAPAQKFRSGALSVSIWRKESKRGDFYTVTAQRAFTQDEGKTWEYSDSFSRDDLNNLGALLMTAWSWINRKEQETKA